MNEHNNKVKITVENLYDDKKLEVTINRFADVNDWIEVFKTIMIHQTFAHETVKDLFEPDEQ